MSSSKNNKSICLLLIEVIAILALIVGLTVGLIYYFGSEKPHIEIPHSLNQIFHTPDQANLITKLQQKSNQYTALWGSNETGIFQFLQHYADIRAAKGGLVIVRRVENNLYETALKFIRYTKDYIESNIDLESELDKTQWIFIIKNGQIPLQEIYGIISKRPKDKIVVGIIDKPNLKNFKKVQYPAILLTDILEVIQQQFNITSKAAQILTNFYGTIPQILHHLDEISYTHEKHLGNNYQELKHLTTKQLKTLKNLCKDGHAKVQGNAQLLEQIGIQIYDNVAYWTQRISRLNYQLEVQTQCIDEVIPQQIRAKIEQQKQEIAQAEARQNEREKKTEKSHNRKPKETKQKKPKSSQSKTTRRITKKSK